MTRIEQNFAAVELGEIQAQQFGSFAMMSATEDFRYRLLLALARDLPPAQLTAAIKHAHVTMKETRERLALARGISV